MLRVRGTGMQGSRGLLACCLQERLGLLLDKEDEMDCLVGGANFPAEGHPS